MGSEKLNVKKEIAGAVAAALLCIVFFGAIAGLFLWVNGETRLPWIIIAVYVAVPIIVIICIVVALVQRIKKLEGDEVNDASKY
ncbi:MAG: hypothetical protein J6N81_08380 [Treponema sp.]|jgi:O-antigen/teichoic acid export membrane protein|nr:hypothetical protein [Treponema sp.]MBO6219574.1 hypothetical protein [Treponema sp.]HAK68320.1 hypothetical protein [Treponema sp.]HBB42181.1 hypothetical protein [Treponema sp.]